MFLLALLLLIVATAAIFYREYSRPVGSALFAGAWLAVGLISPVFWHPLALVLLAAPLVPYITVGIFLASIMALSAVVTLLMLPAILRAIPSLFFGREIARATRQE